MTDPYRADPLGGLPPKRFFAGTNGHVLCIDQRSGATLWKTTIWESKVAVGLMTLLRHQGRIFAACHRSVACLDESDGALLWHTKLSKLGQPVSLALDMNEPGGQLVVAASGHVYGVAADSGAQEWHNSLPGLGFNPICLRVPHATVAQAQPHIVSVGKTQVTLPLEDAQEEPPAPPRAVDDVV